MSFKTRVALAVLAVLGLAGTAKAEIGVADKQILLGSPHGLSGPNVLVGQQTEIGLNILINSINEKGGVHGRQLRIISMDDKYEPDTAIACFQQLRQQGVFALTGLVGSPTSAKYLPMCETYKIPAVGIYSGPKFVYQPVKSYSFATRAPYGEEVKEAIDRLWSAGARRFGVLYQNDAYGADELEAAREALTAHHAQVVVAGSYERNSNNGVIDAFTKVKEANPEVVILACVYKPCAEVAKLAKEAHWNPIFVLNSGDAPGGFLAAAGSDGEGMLVSEVAPLPTANLPAVQDYLKALKKYYPNEKPNYMSLKGYMDGMALVEGLKRAGRDLTRDNFIQAMNSIRKADLGLGPGMELNYTPTDHMGWHKIFFVQIKSGQYVPFTDWSSLKTKLAADKKDKH